MPEPLGNRSVRFAVVGTGIGALHAQGLGSLPGTAELAAVCSRGEAAGALVRSAGTGYSTTRFEDLLADDSIDVIDLCVPPDLHLSMGLAAVKAGKHLYIEKPLARTLDEADRLLDASRDAGVLLMAGHNQRYLEHHRRAKELLDAGRLGTPFLVVAAVHVHGHIDGFRKFFEHAGGGTLIDSGVHKFDLMRWMLGDVETVFSQTGRLFQTQMEGEDTAVVSLRFRSGALGSFSCSWSAKGPRQESLQIFGPLGSLSTEDHGGRLRVFSEPSTGGPGVTEETTFAVDQAESIRRALSGFARALQLGGPSPIPGEDGRSALALALACSQSSATGLSVRMT